MANSILVQVTERVKRLLHDARCLCLCQMLFLSDMVEQLTALAELSYQETNPVSLPSLEQLNDIWVI